MKLQQIGTDPIPQDLAMCNKCRRVVGRHGGEWGAECQCRFRSMPMHVVDEIETGVTRSIKA